MPAVSPAPDSLPAMPPSSSLRPRPRVLLRRAAALQIVTPPWSRRGKRFRGCGLWALATATNARRPPSATFRSSHREQLTGPSPGWSGQHDYEPDSLLDAADPDLRVRLVPRGSV